MLGAWALYPLVVVLISAGIGLLAGRVAGRSLGLGAVPLGFVATIVVFTFLLQIGVSADLVSVTALVAALGGFVLRARRSASGERALLDVVRHPTRETVWFAAAGLIAYLVCMLPILATGRVGILGYYFLNDPAWHTALIEWLHANGAHAAGSIDSSWSMISMQISAGYPLGTYSWPLVGMTFTGASAFALWTPTCALALAMVVLTAHRLVRLAGASGLWATPLALGAGAGFLPLSFVAQGGLKEVLFTLAVLLTGWAIATTRISADQTGATQIRSLLPAAIAISSLLVIFGPGGALWILPIGALTFVLALVLLRDLSRWRVLAITVVWGLLALILALPSAIAALRLLRDVSAVAESGTEVGNLIGAVPLREVFGTWISNDYRLPEPAAGFHLWSFGLSWLALVLVVVGGMRELISRRVAVPIVGLSAAAAIFWIERHYNIYFAAKSYVVITPVVGVAIASALIWLIRANVVARAVGVLLAAGFAISLLGAWAQVYAFAYITPQQRFEELALIDQRISGHGPTLFNDFEEYGESMLRAGLTSQPFAMAGGIVSAPPGGRGSGTQPSNIAGYTPDVLAHFNVIVDRAKPQGSRPGPGFEEWFATKYYVVWRRSGPGPEAFVALSGPTETGTDTLSCKSEAVRNLFALAENNNTPVDVALPARGTVVVPAEKISRTGEWAQQVPDPEGFVNRKLGDSGSFEVSLQPRTKYRMWVQGSFGPGFSVSVNDKTVGNASREQSLRSAWIPLGSFTAAENNTVQLKPRRWLLLRPGSLDSDSIREFAFTVDGARPTVERRSVESARKLCGRQVIWLASAN